MPSCVSHFLHTHSHTHTKGLGPWASRTRWVGAHLLPEPLSMLGGAAGMRHVGARGTRWHKVNSLIPLGPHVVVCVQGQMGVFTTQHFHNPVCFHLTFAQVKWEDSASALCSYVRGLALYFRGLAVLRKQKHQEETNALCPPKHGRSKASVVQTQSRTFGSSVGLPDSDPQGCSVDNPTKANAQIGIRLIYKKNFFNLDF